MWPKVGQSQFFLHPVLFKARLLCFPSDSAAILCPSNKFLFAQRQGRGGGGGGEGGREGGVREVI